MTLYKNEIVKPDAWFYQQIIDKARPEMFRVKRNKDIVILSNISAFIRVKHLQIIEKFRFIQ